MSANVHNKKARLYRQQKGLCHWCNRRMAHFRMKPELPLPPRLATLEHLESRLNPQRGKIRGSRTVLACLECNINRGIDEVRMHRPCGNAAEMQAWIDAIPSGGRP